MKPASLYHIGHEPIVLVEIMGTGVCHAHADTLSALDLEGKFPTIHGYEGARIVCELGTGVTSVKRGDHMIRLYMPECRACETCLSQCPNLRATQDLRQ